MYDQRMSHMAGENVVRKDIEKKNARWKRQKNKYAKGGTVKWNIGEREREGDGRAEDEWDNGKIDAILGTGHNRSLYEFR